MFNLVPLIILLPLLGVIINGTLGYRLGRRWVGIIGAGMVGLSFLLSILVTTSLGALPVEEREVYVSLFTWMRAGSFSVPFEFLVDPLSGLMLLVVTGIGFLIHLYSIGYMDHDEGYARFFTYLNLFIFSMLVLVLGANYLLLFAGWELVGLCSFLLISFWFTNTDYATAGRKAFIVNRIGDFGFALGMMLIFVTFGTLNFREVFAAAPQASVTTVTIITLLLFVGAVGKSAQIPLFVWLPDAMAGPTPVSALIHAATMVTAGVYMVARSNALYDMAPTTQIVVATVGTLTALFAALIAITQTDIKKVLAYSTVSQLGYMMLGVGAGAYVAGVFHLYTHAFFKALLFLGAGAVMHAMNNEQDMTRMGGLFRYIRITSITFIIGAVALAGIPPLAAFWSKDAILEGAFYHGGWYMVLWAVGILTAAITAFYSMRQVGLIFFGEERWRHPAPAPTPAHAAPVVAAPAPVQTIAPSAPAAVAPSAPAPAAAPTAPAAAPAEGEKPRRPRPGQPGLPAAPAASVAPTPPAPVEPASVEPPTAPTLPAMPAAETPAAPAAPGEKPRRPRPGQVSLPTAAPITPSVSETLPAAETPSAPEVPTIVESTAAETPAEPTAPAAAPGEKPRRPRPGQPGLAPAAPAAVTPPASVDPTAPAQPAAPAGAEGEKPRRPRPGQPGLAPTAPAAVTPAEPPTPAAAAAEGDKPRRPRPGQPGLAPATPVTTPAARPEAGQEPLSTAPAVAHGAPPQAVPAAHGVAHADHGHAAHDGHGEPHESPLTMTIPLMVLAVGSVIAGFAGIPGASMIEHWLEPVVSIAEHHGEGVPIIVLTAIATLASLIGAFLGMSMYGVPLGPVKLPRVADPVQLGQRLKPLYNLSFNKFYVDEIYNAVFVEPFKRAAAWFWQAMDQGVIDAAVNGVGALFTWLAAAVRRLQTGYVRTYAVSMLAGVVVLLFWFIFFRLR